MNKLNQGRWKRSAGLSGWLVAAALFSSCAKEIIKDEVPGGDTIIDGGDTGGGDTGGGNTGGGDNNPPPPLFNKTGSVAGKVSATATTGGSQKFGFIRQSGQGNSCANATVTGLLVGSGATTPIVTGAAVDGNFSLTWTEQSESETQAASEIVLSFACDTGVSLNLRCFGKPGDTNLTCDPISNAIVTALEQSLGQSVTGSRLFAGLSVAKIVQGMVETLKLISLINPSQDFVAQLAAASTQEELIAILQSSPINTLLVSIKGLADATKKRNEALNAGQSVAQALSTAWNVGKVIDILIGTGLEIPLTLEEDQGDGGLGLYSDLADRIDAMTGTEFHQEMRSYLTELYADLYGDTPITNPTVVFVCEAAGHRGGSTIVYPPDHNVDINGTVVPFTCYGDKAVRLGLIEEVGSIPSESSIRAFLRQPSTEKDRNLPDGLKFMPQNEVFRLQVELVEIFPEFMFFALNPQGLCGEYLDPNSGDGPPGPATDWEGLTACIRSNKYDVYFSGVLGIYRFLTVPEWANLRISFDDVYKAVTDKMSLRLTLGDSRYNMGYSGIVDPTSDAFSINYSAMLFNENMIDPTTNLPVYAIRCMGQMCSEDPYSTFEFSREEFEMLQNASKPTPEVLFGDLFNVPSLAAIRNQIFNGSHHVPYNTIGNRYFHIAGKYVENIGIHETPIFCAMFNTDTERLVSSYTRGSTRIHCEIAEGEWYDGIQVPNSGTKDYKGWYGLTVRSIDERERFFSLIDLYSGFEVLHAGKPLRIRDISGFPIGSQVDDNDNPLDGSGTMLYNTVKKFCFNTFNGESGSQQVVCYSEDLSYVSISLPNINDENQDIDESSSFYPPVSYQPFTTDILMLRYDQETGSSFEQRIQAAAAVGNDGFDRPDFTTSYPLCFREDVIEFDMDGFASVNAPPLTSWLMNCQQYVNNSQMGPSDYYILVPDWSGNQEVSNREDYVFTVIKNDGSWLYEKLIGDPSYPNCDVQQITQCPRLRVTLPDVETSLDGPSVGPLLSFSYIHHFQIQNFRYDGRFDPYCDDQDGDGACDCFRDTDGDGIYETHLTAESTPSAASCNVSDKVGLERTFSELAFVHGGQDIASIWAVIEACGNLSGDELNQCLGNQNEMGHSLSSMQFPLEQIFVCGQGNSTRPPKYIDRDILFDFSGTADQTIVGGGCDGSNPGPVTLIKFAERRNAFDVAKPQSTVKLLATALQQLSTGTQLSLTDNVFGFQEALAMLMYRLQLPVQNITIKGPAKSAPLMNYNVEDNVVLSGATTRFIPLNSSNPEPIRDATAAILRTFLEKGNLLPADAASFRPNRR